MDYFIPISLFLIRLLVYQILLIKTYRNQTIIITRLSNPPVYPQISYLIYKTNGLVYIFYNNLKMNEQINEQIIDQMFQQAKNIEQNRKQRNKKYNTCLNEFKTFLNKEVEQLEGTDVQSIKNNDILRDIFENTYERILDSSDLAIRKIKLTYHQKKLFWNNVIKVNPDMPDIQLKKYFYQQKNNADDLYYQSIDRQKDKHKEYAMIISNKEKKEPLRDYQYSNKIFQGKVYKESNSMNLWQHKSNNLHNDYYNIQPYLSRQNNSHQQFVKSPVYTKNEINSFKSNTYKPAEDKSLSFLNNFIRRQ